MEHEKRRQISLLLIARSQRLGLGQSLPDSRLPIHTTPLRSIINLIKCKAASWKKLDSFSALRSDFERDSRSVDSQTWVQLVFVAFNGKRIKVRRLDILWSVYSLNFTQAQVFQFRLKCFSPRISPWNTKSISKWVSCGVSGCFGEPKSDSVVWDRNLDFG